MVSGFSILQSIELIQPIQWGSLFDEDISKHEEFTSCNDGETTRGDGTVLALLAVARRPTNLGLGRFLQQPSSFVSGKEPYHNPVVYENSPVALMGCFGGYKSLYDACTILEVYG